jgi:hypothetical protein
MSAIDVMASNFIETIGNLSKQLGPNMKGLSKDHLLEIAEKIRHVFAEEDNLETCDIAQMIMNMVVGYPVCKICNHSDTHSQIADGIPETCHVCGNQNKDEWLWVHANEEWARQLKG